MSLPSPHSALDGFANASKSLGIAAAVAAGLAVCALIGLIVYFNYQAQSEDSTPKMTLGRVFALVFSTDNEYELERAALVAMRPSEKDEEQSAMMALNRAAHLYASQQWCQASGFVWDKESRTCAHSAHSCHEYSNTDPKTSMQNPFMQWRDNHCVAAITPLVYNYCTKHNLAYYPGNITCDDKTGICKSDMDAPTCLLPKAYCKKMGMDFDSDAKLGDCYINDAQAIVESILGKSLTRKYKEAGAAVGQACRSGPFSSDCMKSLGNMAILAEKIEFSTARKFILDRVSEIGDNCNPSNISDASDFLACNKSLFRFLPSVYFFDAGAKMLDGLLDMSLGKWIPGFPTGLIGDGYAAIGKYGGIAMDATIKYGKVAGEAMYQAGILIAKGAMLAFAQISRFTGEAAVAVANAINLAGMAAVIAIGRSIDDALQVATVIGMAFVQGGAALGVFVAETLTRGVDALADAGEVIGKAFGQAGKAFVHGLSDVGGVFEDIGNSIANGAKAVACTIIPIC